MFQNLFFYRQHAIRIIRFIGLIALSGARKDVGNGQQPTFKIYKALYQKHNP